MSEPAEDLEQDEQPTRKRGRAEIMRLAAEEEAKFKPDLYRCRAELCRTTVDANSRAGHLTRCAHTAAGTPLEQAFEPRDRGEIATTVRRGRPKRPPRPILPTAPREPVEQPDAGDEIEEQQEATAAPPPLEIVRAPAPPAPRLELLKERLAARETTTTEDTTVKKDDWITTTAAAEQLNVTASAVQYLVKHKHLVGEKRGNGVRAPLFIDPDSIEKLKAARAGDGEKAPPPRQRKARAITPKLKAAKSKARPTEGLRGELGGDLRDDVRALLRNLDREWMTTDSVLEKLRGLVA